MAGDRHGKHNTTTISFRVNSYEKATIEERVKVSGMKKQDYIVRSCIYNLPSRVFFFSAAGQMFFL